jgi:hypothetical protein
MVLPVTYFLEKPFQNWTRVSADLLGTVFLYLDYSVPVDVLREEARRVVAGAELWDKKVFGVQVTDCKSDVMEIRVLMSASNSGRIFDLRCLVREKLVDFVQRHHPGSLPKFRAEVKAETTPMHMEAGKETKNPVAGILTERPKQPGD